MTLFEAPAAHRDALEDVKRHFNITHRLLDGFIYRFLENKKFSVPETIAKLDRRYAMEREQMLQYTITPVMRASLASGVVQFIGNDREGHPTLYITTSRDFPSASEREWRTRNFDLWLSYASRETPLNPIGKVTWLVNQLNASVWKNTDLMFQREIALRISKFFPGIQSRVFVANMSNAVSFVVKPLLAKLPAAISECIVMLSEHDVAGGALLQHFDRDVLPVALGGDNDCDNPRNWVAFADAVSAYTAEFQAALRADPTLTIKQLEMMKAHNVDKNGRPMLRAAAAVVAVTPVAEPSSSPMPAPPPPPPVADSEPHELFPHDSDDAAAHNVVVMHVPIGGTQLRWRAAHDAEHELRRRSTLKLLSLLLPELNARFPAVLEALRRHRLDAPHKQLLLGCAEAMERTAARLLAVVSVKAEPAVSPATATSGSETLQFPLCAWVHHAAFGPGDSYDALETASGGAAFLDAIRVATATASERVAHARDEADAIRRLAERLCPPFWAAAPGVVPRRAMLEQLRAKRRSAWRGIARAAHEYDAAKAAIAVLQQREKLFLQSNPHAASADSVIIDTKANDYLRQLAGVTRHHVAARSGCLFHLVPPGFADTNDDGNEDDDGPAVEDVLRREGMSGGNGGDASVVAVVTFSDIAALESAALASIRRVREQLRGGSAAFRVRYVAERAAAAGVVSFAQTNGVAHAGRPLPEMLAHETQQAASFLGDELQFLVREWFFASAAPRLIAACALECGADARALAQAQAERHEWLVAAANEAAAHGAALGAVVGDVDARLRAVPALPPSAAVLPNPSEAYTLALFLLLVLGWLRWEVESDGAPIPELEFDAAAIEATTHVTLLLADVEKHLDTLFSRACGVVA